MIKLLTISMLLISFNVFGQTPITPEIQETINEGKLLFMLDKALWYGTEMLTDSFQLIDKTSAYILYSQNDQTKAVFVSKDIKPKVIASFTLDSLLNPKTMTIDFKDRKLSLIETNLLLMQQIAMVEIAHDTLFKPYPNSNFDLLPIITNEYKKVIVITSPTKEGRVIFGNDYEIIFDKNNNIKSKKAIHSGAFPIRYGSIEVNGKKIEGSMHRHDENTDPMLTSTDICTLLTYAAYAKWKEYFVISKTFLSTWDCIKNELHIEKIN